MGACCVKPSIIPPTASSNTNGYIIWIDKNVNSQENEKYITKLIKRNFKVDTCDDIYMGLNEILLNKDKYFKDIYLILNGSFNQDFFFQYKKYLTNILVVPKIAIFTKDKGIFLENNSNINDIIENKFYNLGGVQTFFKGRLFNK